MRNRLQKKVINLETTSICNRKCIVCPQGDKSNKLIRKDMSLKDLDKLLERIKEAYNDGIFVREIINAGYGETFLHKNLKDVFEKYKNLKDYFKENYNKETIISIVTNGSEITKEKLDIVSHSLDILKFSFPTSDPEQYGLIMYRDKEYGNELIENTVKNLKLCMIAYRDKKIPELRIHISPPVQHSFEHFPRTLHFLTELANQVNLDNLKIVIFPSTSNRAGSIKKENFVNNLYRKYIRKYNKKKLNGVKINFLSEFNVFYKNYFSLAKILTQPFPCIWKGGSISIDSSGNYRFCINDVFSEAKIGNIYNMGLKKASINLKKASPSKNCYCCNQNPSYMGEDISERIYSTLSRFRMRFIREK